MEMSPPPSKQPLEEKWSSPVWWGGGIVHLPSRQGTSNLRERDARREPSTTQHVSAVPKYMLPEA